jgi:hypothetical protein
MNMTILSLTSLWPPFSIVEDGEAPVPSYYHILFGPSLFLVTLYGPSLHPTVLRGD